MGDGFRGMLYLNYFIHEYIYVFIFDYIFAGLMLGSYDEE